MEQRRLDVDWLVADEPVFTRVVAEHGRPPEWERPPVFATLVLQILEQQISLDAAAAHFARLRAAAGGIGPAAVLSLDDAVMRAAGVSRQKMRYLRELAMFLEDGRLDLGVIAAADDTEARRLLMAVPGIGPWTADVFLLFALQRRDLFPVGDLALRAGVAEVLERPAVPTPTETAEIAARWAPRRSAAATLVWHAYLSRRHRTM